MTIVVQNGVTNDMIEDITREQSIDNKMDSQIEKWRLCIHESHNREPYKLKKIFIYSTYKLITDVKIDYSHNITEKSNY